MPRVVAVRLLETCLDRTVIKQFELDTGMDEPTMRRLGEEASLQFFPSFPRPYYRIARERAWVAQGILGDRTVRITFSPCAEAGEEERVRARLAGAAEETTRQAGEES